MLLLTFSMSTTDPSSSLRVLRAFWPTCTFDTSEKMMGLGGGGGGGGGVKAAIQCR